MPTILFICTANRYRSPIAAACFQEELNKHGLGGNWVVLSAGTWTKDGLPAWPDAVTSASQLGLDIADHRSAAITADLLQQADLVLVMEQGQKEALQNEFPKEKEKIFLLSETTKGKVYDIPDPIQDPDAGNVTAEIITLIQNGFDKIAEMAMRKA